MGGIVIPDPKGGKVWVHGKNPSGDPQLIKTDSEGRLETVNSMHTTAKARAYLSTVQTIPTDVHTVIAIDAASFDPGGNLDLANHRYVVSVAGFYLVTSVIMYDNVGVVADKRCVTRIQKNGAAVSVRQLHTSVSNYISSGVMDVLECAVDDYIDVTTFHGFGADADLAAKSSQTFMAVHLLSAV